MRAQDNTEGVARPIVVRLFLWLARTFQWKYEVNVSHADLGGLPQRQNLSPIMQSRRCRSLPQSHLVGRRQTHHRGNARRHSRSSEGAEPSASSKTSPT